MCKPKQPKIAKFKQSKPRALARQPMNRPISVEGNSRQRTTVRNPDGQVRRAPTAALGGQGIVLGGYGG